MSRFEEKLANAKAQSMMQVLKRSTRLLTEVAVAKKRRLPGPQPRKAHAALYAHISLTGTRPSVIAEKMGITPQAVAQLVGELEEMGFAERVPDPEDGRARLVCFTARGRKDILDGFRVMEEVEQNLRSHLGARDYKRLHSLLGRLEAAAEAEHAKLEEDG